MLGGSVSLSGVSVCRRSIHVSLCSVLLHPLCRLMLLRGGIVDNGLSSVSLALLSGRLRLHGPSRMNRCVAVVVVSIRLVLGSVVYALPGIPMYV